MVSLATTEKQTNAPGADMPPLIFQLGTVQSATGLKIFIDTLCHTKQPVKPVLVQAKYSM
jgi:hypothetical protein